VLSVVVFEQLSPLASLELIFFLQHAIPSSFDASFAHSVFAFVPQSAVIITGAAMNALKTNAMIMFFDFMVHSISVYVDNFSERTNGSSSPKRNILIKNPMDKEFFQCLGFVFRPVSS
jgi:hypothetical protein